MSTTLDEKTAPRNITKMLTAWIFNEKNLWADLWTKNHNKKKRFSLTLSWQKFLTHRNQSIDLQIKLMDWFLYDRDICHERVTPKERDIFTILLSIYGETFLGKWLKKFSVLLLIGDIVLKLWDHWCYRMVINKPKYHPHATPLMVSQELDFLEYMWNLITHT